MRELPDVTNELDRIRIAEQQAQRRWPLAVASTLVVSLLAVAWFAWDSHQRAQAVAEASPVAAGKDDVIAEINAKLARMEAERGALMADLSSLDAKLKAATTEAERAELQARKEAVKRELAAQQEQLQPERERRRRSSTRKAAPEPKPQAEASDPDQPTRRRDPIVLEGDKPLDGLP